MAKQKPYLTTTPWLPFTMRQRMRKLTLARCPSAACHRAKACIDAHDDIYCQRSYRSVDDARRFLKPDPKTPTLPSNPTHQQVKIYAEFTEERLAQAVARNKEMRQQWKSGKFDAEYGKFRAEGVWKQPPERQSPE